VLFLGAVEGGADRIFEVRLTARFAKANIGVPSRYVGFLYIP
jgi:hypothetical protein